MCVCRNKMNVYVTHARVGVVNERQHVPYLVVIDVGHVFTQHGGQRGIRQLLLLLRQH